MSISRSSAQEFQAEEIRFRPTSLRFDHAFQRAEGEGVGCVVERERDTAPIRVTIVAMASLLALQLKAICGQWPRRFGER